MALKSRETFGSRMGMLLAMAGSAIGLGNIWRFPYMMGKNGGAAFILIYVIMLVVLCLPVMVSEYLIGRRGASNPFSSFDRLAPGSKWRWIGFWPCLHRPVFSHSTAWWEAGLSSIWLTRASWRSLMHRVIMRSVSGH